MLVTKSFRPDNIQRKKVRNRLRVAGGRIIYSIRLAKSSAGLHSTLQIYAYNY
jgi:hypothetical protein